LAATTFFDSTPHHTTFFFSLEQVDRAEFNENSARYDENRTPGGLLSFFRVVGWTFYFGRPGLNIQRIQRIQGTREKKDEIFRLPLFEKERLGEKGEQTQKEKGNWPPPLFSSQPHTILLFLYLTRSAPEFNKNSTRAAKIESGGLLLFSGVVG